MLKELSKFKNKTINFINYNASRILNIAEKNIKVKLRFKSVLIYSIINPFIGIIMTIIILIKFISSGVTLGGWNENNYYIFVFTALEIELLRRVVNDFPVEFRHEKFWKTLPALLIAPFNMIHLLLGIVLSHLIIISIPFLVFFLITYFIYPISIISIISILFIFLIIEVIFCGIGLFFGVFAISQENYWRILSIGLQILFYFSCITYPFDVFPQPIQILIILNPFYYIFNIVRIIWIEDNIIFSILNHPWQFIILSMCGFIIPITSMYFFKFIYKKFGIVGY